MPLPYCSHRKRQKVCWIHRMQVNWRHTHTHSSSFVVCIHSHLLPACVLVIRERKTLSKHNTHTHTHRQHTLNTTQYTIRTKTREEKRREKYSKEAARGWMKVNCKRRKESPHCICTIVTLNRSRYTNTLSRTQSLPFSCIDRRKERGKRHRKGEKKKSLCVLYSKKVLRFRSFPISSLSSLDTKHT